ncbi:hypothetical protein [Nocardia wallacei]|nr:hypothetical protein [Nocardia wallacei]
MTPVCSTVSSDRVARSAAAHGSTRSLAGRSAWDWIENEVSAE